jgi:hypothetical protein
MKRLLAALAALLSLASLIVSAGALWWIWTVKQPVTDKTAMVFGRIEDALAVTDRTIEQARANLEASRIQISLVHQTSRSDGRKKPDFLGSMMARSFASKVSPNLHEMRNTLDRVTEASIVLHSVLGSVQDVGDAQVFDPEQVRALQGQVGGVTQASWELSDLLDPTHGGDDTEDAEEKSGRIVAALDEVLAMTAEFQKGVHTLQARAEHYRTRTLYWLDLGPKLATAFLVWVMLSQLIVIAVAVRGMARPSSTAMTSA